MSVVEGFESLTGSYLGQDWDLFGATPDESLVNFVKHRRRDVAASIEGFDRLLASSMTEDELDRHWIYELHAGYDPRDDGFTYREWFAHARDLLQSEAAKRSG